MTQLSRRRFLSISAACAALPAGAVAAPSAQWRGVALGAGASLRIEGLDDAEAAPIIAAVEAELERLELIFSLYRPESQLSALNRDGRLTDPAPELLDVLSLCSALYDATEGAFDPSVQPLWLALAQGGTENEVEAARGAVGWQGVSVQPDEVLLPRPGLSGLTLNGIAQGAITDRISGLLKSFGLTDVLVDMGEIAALGRHADGRDWQVGLLGPDGAIRQRITLRDRAVATSAPDATRIGGMQAHILDPRGGNPLHQAISVSAPSAAIADGLSTALCLIPREEIALVLSRFPRSKLEMLI
ncbi:ApbE family lipoprotein [Ruegeria marisrubri]|uniref:FAD:protein FMN transferase n=1 Tax=Ruegeria marisrubri TaxID=1685379 RepID=A0A0X3TCC4_9RHOB|nr:FAD:protein FMN transferase [Ruegeria marisrubri]KUJ73437.1 ApbE family lipoprotein [Ruegeria marisrubri]